MLMVNKDEYIMVDLNTFPSLLY